ncbi:MAG: YDG/SRA domain-containing protein [Gammaproteobacteria bacterium]|nr:YDG/SRA domain-containing protein [Gammaproteobacteria bacterium]
MIGEIEGVEDGAIFADRQALHDAGVHRGTRAGIGSGGESVVLPGGYVDDVDDGEVIIYTGQGGRDLSSGRQVKDQELTRGNKLLAENFLEGNPIRVSEAQCMTLLLPRLVGINMVGYIVSIVIGQRQGGMDI